MTSSYFNGLSYNGLSPLLEVYSTPDPPPEPVASTLKVFAYGGDAVGCVLQVGLVRAPYYVEAYEPVTLVMTSTPVQTGSVLLIEYEDGVLKAHQGGVTALQEGSLPSEDP